jgi:RimJ/RimL family protein N-acetyltransferase
MPITLHTQRLTIREYDEGDLQARHQLYVEAFGGTNPIEATEAWLAWTILNYRALARLHQPPYGDYAVVLKESGEVIGSVGLVPSVVPWGVLPAFRIPDEPISYQVSAEFGLFWGILPAYQGNGYATEAARGFIQHIFSLLNPRRIVATTERDNLASQAVMKKLGMTILTNPGDKPFWFEVVGVLENRG